ncbi:hypothetical protein LCGC14_2062820, partial [marine sediment metagenome]
MKIRKTTIWLLLTLFLTAGVASGFNLITMAGSGAYSWIDAFTDTNGVRIDAHTPTGTPEMGPSSIVSATGTITGNPVDFTTGSETDGPSKVTVSERKITLTAGDRDEDYYVTFDQTAGTITNFTHWVDVNVTALTNDGNSSLWAWAISNADDDIDDIDIAGGDAISVIAAHANSTNYKVQLYSLDSGTPVIVDSSAYIAVGTKTYWAISRTGTTGTVEIYSTAALRIAGAAGDVDTITGTVVGTAFRYVYGIASRNNGLTAKDISGTVENLWLGVDGAGRHTETLSAELVTDGGFTATTKAAVKVVTGITKATPGIVTFAAGHGYIDGTVVYFSLLDGMTELNTQYWKLREIAGNTFELSDAAIGTWDSSSLDTSGYGAAEVTGNGRAQKVDFTNWTEGVGWHPGVDGAGALTGTADCDGEQGAGTNLANNMLTIYSFNKSEYTISNYTSGALLLGLSGGGQFLFPRGSNATFVEYGIARSATAMFLQGASTFIGSVDDVSVKSI